MKSTYLPTDLSYKTWLWACFIGISLIISGCAGTSVIRVVEYGAGGAAGLITGGAGGCAVHQQKGDGIFAEVKMTYVGEKCVVEVSACPSNQPCK
jgi:hypothetical protein